MMIFGKRCIFCNETKKKDDCEFNYRFIGICSSCMNKIESEKAVRIIDVRKPLSAVIPCTHYTEDVRYALHRYKFANDRAYEKAMEYMAKKILSKWSQLSRFDAVVTLPLSKQRMTQRGYNQASFMSDVVSDLFRVPKHDEYIKKIRDTKKQSNLRNVERVLNISGAYEASTEVEGKNIILVDDIYTTGATMTEVAKTLKAAGAKVIVGVVFASVKQKKRNENIVW